MEYGDRRSGFCQSTSEACFLLWWSLDRRWSPASSTRRNRRLFCFGPQRSAWPNRSGDELTLGFARGWASGAKSLFWAYDPLTASLKSR